MVKLSDRELIDLLQAEDFPTTGSSQMLAFRCKNNNLPTTRTIKTGLFPHWEGKPKGLINVCVERGLVPLQQVLVRQYYSKNGKKVNGEIDESTSLVSILEDCSDFKNEVSILQKVADKYNANAWFTPKYHCEIAGEGIEYLWGYGKQIYRRVPMVQKKKKQFEKLVKSIFSRQTISSSAARKFSRRARQYVCAYHVLHNQENKEDEDKLSISLVELEKVMLKFKTHRCALDYDFAFIEGEVMNSRGTKKLNTAQSTLMKFMAVPLLKIYPGGKLRTDD